MRNYESVEYLLKELTYKDGVFYRKDGSVPKPSKTGKGQYYAIAIRKDNKRYRSFVHVLVYALHHGIEELKKHETIDHINGDKYDNRIENLQGLNLLDNSQKDSGGKLTVEDAKMIKFLLNEGFTQTAIARVFGVSSNTISKIKTGKRWKTI
jgi:HNH endonuclease